MPRVIENKKKEKGPRSSYSTYFITINTNRKDFDKDKPRSAIQQIFGNDEIFYALIKGDTSRIDKEYSTVQFSAEAGPKTGYIHSHVLIKLKHTTKTHFNIELLRRILIKELGLTDVHIDVKAFGASDKVLEEYIENQ